MILPRVPHRLPRIEFVWLKEIDFYPARPKLENLLEICLGTKTRTIGDALILTPLARKLKAKYPQLRIRTYPRAFNPTVFLNNPYIDGVDYLPDALYGDDNNWGEGHLIQIKERFFEVPVGDPPKPEIFLSQSERHWARQNLPSERPVCFLHAWGHTWGKVAKSPLWEELVKSLSSRYRCYQLGVRGQPQIPGCEGGFLFPKSHHYARRLFALMEQASAFIGVNSGPMHVAVAFDVPSVILTEQGSIDEIFQNRARAPYFLHRNWANGFLYPQNLHLDVPNLKTESVIEKASDYLFSKTKKKNIPE